MFTAALWCLCCTVACSGKERERVFTQPCQEVVLKTEKGLNLAFICSLIAVFSQQRWQHSTPGVQVVAGRGLSGRQGKDRDSTRVDSKYGHILPSCSHVGSSCLPAEHHVLHRAGRTLHGPVPSREGLRHATGQPSPHRPLSSAFLPGGAAPDQPQTGTNPQRG